MKWLLPEREFAKKVGFTHQVQWVEGGNPCFVRCKSGQAADAWADKLRAQKLSPTVIDLTDALQLH